MASSPSSHFETLFAQHRNAAIPDLWPWQKEVLEAYERLTGDAAVELPTGAGKTLLGLLVGEDFRERQGRPVAYLAGNKQLARQVERHARALNFPVVRFQDAKDTWVPADVRAYNFGNAIGVMNYWNYINAKPGIDPAGLLILDDVHLLEGPLRDFFTVEIPRSGLLYQELLERIVSICPYYSLAEDLLNGVTPLRPPEMLVFPDSAALADEVRDLLDGRLTEGSEAWWAWQQIRDRLEICCWLVSGRAVTFTPYIPPSQTITHFSQPARRLYLSATIGSVDDLRRRLGTPPVEKLTASVQPRQGQRLVVLRSEVDPLSTEGLIDALRPLVRRHRKALWLCARRDTATAFNWSLTMAGLPGAVRRLERDNGADEAFGAEPSGHLIAAGRYDGMDFPDDACRLEVVPEVPVATSDLEEFASAYLRDAAFAEARFAQRVAQALGRCNRSENDRAVYILSDPEFVGRFSQRRTMDALPDDVRGDISAALERSDRGFGSGLDEADQFLTTGSIPSSSPPPARAASQVLTATTAGNEVDGFLALWRQDYGGAAAHFDRVADQLSQTHEHRAFWLAMRALALYLAGRYGGDPAASAEAIKALRAAATAGATSSFFTRLRLAEARLIGNLAAAPAARYDDLFVTWDQLITRYGASGPRFDRWAGALLDELRSADHDTVARSIARLGSEVLGLVATAPKPTSGEQDAHWELPDPQRIIAFEVKLAPKAQAVTNEHVEQAEGAVRALQVQRSRATRGLLVTPWNQAGGAALDRLKDVRLIQQSLIAQEAQRLLDLLREYRRGWTDDAAVRTERRAAVEGRLPPRDWLWKATDRCQHWVQRPELDQAWRPAPRTVGRKK